MRNVDRDSGGIKGFSLRELLVVVAIIGLLTMLHIPALGKMQTRNQFSSCIRNLKELTMAWGMYAVDNEGELVGAAEWHSLHGRVPNWAGGSWLDSARPKDPANWDHEMVTKKSPLWPYAGNQLDIWRCPSDPSIAINDRGQTVPRIRSYSMNNWVGGPGWTASGSRWKVYRKLTDINNPGPARTFVFIDEREDSINDGYFIVDMSGYPNALEQLRMIDYPADRHNKGANLSFADGHVENWQWQDRRTMPQHVLGGSIPLNVPSPYNADIFRLQGASTRQQ